MVISALLEIPAELQSLMSLSRIISDFRLVIPCILSRWFVDPRVDILRELQLMLDMEILGNIRPGLTIVRIVRTVSVRILLVDREFRTKGPITVAMF